MIKNFTDKNSLQEFVKNHTEYEHYGLPVVQTEDGDSYAVSFSVEESDKALENYILENIYIFSANLLEKITKIPAEVFRKFQNDKKLTDDYKSGIFIECVYATCGMKSFINFCKEVNDGAGTYLAPMSMVEEVIKNDTEAIAYLYQVG